MRLSLTLLVRLRRYPPVKGSNKRGKDRPPIILEKCQVNKYVEDLRIDEKNMFYLRHPYLSIQESFGHESDLRKPERELIEKELEDPYFYDGHYTLEQAFASMKSTDDWDDYN